MTLGLRSYFRLRGLPSIRKIIEERLGHAFTSFFYVRFQLTMALPQATTRLPPQGKPRRNSRRCNLKGAEPRDLPMRDNKTTAVRYLTETPLLLASQENKEGREGPGYDGFIYFSNKNFASHICSHPTVTERSHGRRHCLGQETGLV